MTLRLFRRPRHRSRGQSIVEFALVLPLMLFLFVGIVDLGRVYTAMIGVESAAREAADYATTRGAPLWVENAVPSREAEMRERACTAASSLPDFVGSFTDCTNPMPSFCVSPDNGANCYPLDSFDPTWQCDAPDREVPGPCRITVKLQYNFNLFIPLNFEAFGVRYGLPSSLPITRSSTFAMTDFE
jgi:hypothetical protein